MWERIRHRMFEIEEKMTAGGDIDWKCGRRGIFQA
jgi:hypothetical protein